MSNNIEYKRKYHATNFYWSKLKHNNSCCNQIKLLPIPASKMQSSEMESKLDATFPVHLSYQGKTAEIAVTIETTTEELVAMAREQFLPTESNNGASTVQFRLLYKGKRLEVGYAERFLVTPPTKTPKIIVLGTEVKTISELNSKRSDPTIRGFDNEKRTPKSVEKGKTNDWGPLLSMQDKNHKFCRFDVCTRQSFGHRPGDSTPHEFEARNLLMKLATDPGIVAIMKDRELIVGTLGEMDPIDDRLMQQEQQQGVCLLGYNTNGGTRIDLKLRTDDLKTFRPYPQLICTLVHELSHNWVGDHNLLFWTNYGQMMIDYCAMHAFGTSDIYISGQSTGQIAGLPASIRANMDRVFDHVMENLRQSMMQHGLDPLMIEPLVRQRCDKLIQQKGYGTGHMLGSAISTSIAPNSSNLRELALQAAERRHRETQNHTDDDSKGKTDISKIDNDNNSKES